MDIRDTASYAIVGLACRLPGGVRNPEELWELLLNKQDAWSCVPSDRFNEEAFYHPDISNGNGTTNHRGGHFLDEDLSLFDNEFFHISPQQAASMDPQQRISLEVIYEALENAGLPRHSFTASNTAVYMATFSRDYDRLLYRDPLNIPIYLTTGVGDAILANRISHAMDLKGPSVTLDTGCSGSLVSVHQACTALQVGDADIAIAGSANLILGPDQQFGMTSVRMLNDDGKSYPFNEHGSGYGRGEGVAAIIIKRLADSIRDRDHIHAVIRSSAVNQDGYTVAGITNPNASAQAKLQLTALERAGLQSQDVTYVEAHGTGTRAGDEAELEGLSQSYGQTRSSPLQIGSIKGNLGHTESTSGLAGLIKVVQALRKGKIPPTILTQNPRESLKTYSDQIQVVKQTMEWPKNAKKIASINSFGYGGTNAHIILSAFDSKSTQHLDLSKERSPEKHLMVFSAANIDSLQEILAGYQKWLQNTKPEFQLADLSYTLTCRRSHLPWKVACIAGNTDELIEQLQSASNSIQAPAPLSPQIAWVFTGQGSQWVGMAMDLLTSDDFPVFKDSMALSRDILLQLGVKWNLIEELLMPEDKSKLMFAEYAQPSTTAIQIALVDVLRSLKVTPDAVIGHSSGEIAAAYAAGYLDHLNAMKIAHCRGKIPTICRDLNLPSGAMLAVGLSQQDIQPYLSSNGDKFVSVACVNSPESITLSGDAESITEVARRLSDDGVFNKLLRVDLAYHSEHMHRASKEYYQNLLRHNVKCNSHGSIPFFSTVSGHRKSDGFDVSYWVANLVSKVKFLHGLEDLMHFLHATCKPKQSKIILELGSHSALGGPIRQCGLQGDDFAHNEYIPSFKLKESAVYNILEMVGQLFVRSVHIDFTMLRSSIQTAQLIPYLPSYAWNHNQGHWWESWISKAYRFRQHPYHDLLGLRMAEVSEPSWRHRINFSRSPWLADHQIEGIITFPGSAYLCMALEGARQVAKDDHSLPEICRLSLNNVKFCKTLVVPTPDTEVEMQLRFTRRHCTTRWKQQYDFSIYAMTAQDDWLQHCYGSVSIYYDQGTGLGQDCSSSTKPLHSEKWQPYCVSDLYKTMKDMGNTYGPTFTGITSYSSTQNQALAEITTPNIAKAMLAQYVSPHIIHPTTLDIIMHSALPLTASNLDNIGGAIVPTSIRELWLSIDPILSAPKHHIDTNINLKRTFGRGAVADLEVRNGDIPEVLLSITGMKICSLAPTSDVTSSSQDSTFILSYDIDIDFATQCADPKVQPKHSPFSSKVQSLFYSYIRQMLFKNPCVSILEIGTSITAYKTLIDEFKQEGLTPTAWTFKTIDEVREAKLDGFDLIIWDDIAHHIGNVLDSLTTLTSLLQESAGHLLLRAKHFDVSLPSTDSTEERGSITNSFDPAKLDTISDRYGLLLRDHESSPGPHLSTTLLFSRASSSIASAPSCEIRCVLPASSHLRDFMQQIIDYIPACSPIPLDFREPASPESVIIVIDDATCPILTQDSNEAFDGVRSLLSLPFRIVWATISFGKPQVLNLGRHLITGFARTAHAENRDLSMVTIDIHMDSLTEQTKVIEYLNKCICSSFGESDKNSIERELVYRRGQMEIPRLLKSESLSNWVSSNTERHIYQSKFCGSSQHLTLNTEQSMRCQRIIFQEEPASSDLLEYEVEIAVSYCIAPTLFSRSDTLKPCSGIVIGIGPGVDGVRIGDEVFTTGIQTHSNRMRTLTSGVHKIRSPSLRLHNVVGLSDLMAALYSFRYVHLLQPGEKVLIDGPMDGARRMAAMVAQHIGAQVIIAAHDDAEYDMLIQHSHFEAFRILSPSVLSSTRKLQDSLEGGIISAILTRNSSLSSVLFENLQSFGSLILLPERDNNCSTEMLIPENAPENISINRCDISALMFVRRNLVEPLMKEALSFAQANDLVLMEEPRIKTWAQYEKEVFSKSSKVMSSESTISCDDTRAVLVQVLHKENSLHLDPNGTYVLAGGLGDLGRRLILLLARLGARDFVTLSRNIPPPDSMREIQNGVATFDSKCRIIPLKCDIAQKDAVHDAYRQIIELGLPPVRGIIQSAVVLKDEPLETMKLETFQIPLQTKYLGTVNLEEAFGAQDLEFFLMLSSAVNMVGSGAQANYNAGNAVLDGLAYEKLSSQHRYQSISLGFLEDTQALLGNNTRISALQRQGLVPIDAQELENFFTFSFRRGSELQSHAHRVIGLGVDAISKSSIANGNINSPMFIHVRQLKEEETGSSTSEEEFHIPFNELSNEEKLQFITTKLCKQLAHMVSYQAREFNSEEILLDIGMDSLMAIELRNWISHEFKVVLQSSEILDHISISEVASKVLDRQGPLASEVDTESARSSDKSDLDESLSHDPTPRTSISAVETIPPLPLPSLDSSLSQLIDSRRLFCSDSEIEELCEAVKSFEQEAGATAQSKLAEIYPSLKLQDQISAAIYLQPRSAIPTRSAYFFNHKSSADIRHSQAQRCAIISLAALQFRDLCFTENLEPDCLDDALLEAENYKWLFHAARQPEELQDRLTCGHVNPNIAVLSNGHVYVLKAPEALTQSQQIRILTTQFQYIKDNSKSPVPSLAMLTGENRHVWAHLQAELTTHDPQNIHLLETITHSAFVVCMDSSTPESPSEQCNSVWISTPENHNRWWDKTLQLVVTQNGASSMIGEHTQADGITHRLLLEHIQSAIDGCHDNNVLDPESDEIVTEDSEQYPKELLFDLPAVVTKHIEAMQSTSHSMFVSVEYAELRIQDFGRSTFSKAGYPVKACALLTILLAITLWNPDLEPVPIWEAVSQAMFRHGRVDWVQLTSETVWKFLQTACSSIDNIDQPAIQALWQSAIQDNTKIVTAATRGHGFVRHLYALKTMLQADDPLPKLFETRAWEATVRGGLDQSVRVDALPPRKGPYGQWAQGGFMTHGKNACFIHYHFEEDDSLFVSVRSEVGRSNAFVDCVQKSVQFVRKLL